MDCLDRLQVIQLAVSGGACGRLQRKLENAAAAYSDELVSVDLLLAVLPGVGKGVAARHQIP